MARYRNALTGVVVDVDDATAAELGAAYEPVRKPAATKAPAKQTDSK